MDQIINNGNGQRTEAENFYIEALNELINCKIPFLLGGAFAIKHFTGIHRDTKDLDIFCKAGDFTKLLKALSNFGYKTEIHDARWLAKAYKNDHFIDIIFNTVNNLCPVDDSWFHSSVHGDLFDIPVHYLAPEELFWCKIYVQNRERYDGADLNHIILKKGRSMDWKRVLGRLEQHWHLLLGQFLNFQFVYPSERDAVPKWLFEELLVRAKEQYELPVPIVRVCRGPLIEQIHYTTDVIDWNYRTMTICTL
jgi:hypothetical protein